MPTLKGIDGYVGVLHLERRVSDNADIIVMTFWKSLDSIRGFAGEDLEAAVVTDEAASLLTQFDRRVRHYEVVLEWDGY